MRARKERFADLGAACERAVELCHAQGANVPLAISDTGERLLLGEQQIGRLASLAARAAPVDDRVAWQVFGALEDATLDDLYRWLLFKMRSAGIAQRQRLHVLGAILDAISPDVAS